MMLLCTTGIYAQSDTINKANNSMEKVILPFTSISKERLVGAIDYISGDDIRKSTEYRTQAALAGLASGLYVSKFAGQPGENGASLKVRGRSRGGSGDGPMIIVDGVPYRSLYDVSLESIESVYVLKDITAKMLYGPSAADGVIVLKTKRGLNGKRKLNFYFEGGIKTPSALPEYLNSAQYAEYYNKARLNDGLEAYYSDNDIAAYKDGTSPIVYPNVDYYDTFLKKSMDYQRISGDLTGGDDKTQYYVNFEYTHEDGLEKVGDDNTFNELRIATNLDYQVNDVIKINLDLATQMDLRKRSNITATSFFDALSSHRPNDYPLFVSSIGNNPDSLGWSPVANRTNLYGDLTKLGYVSDEEFRAKTSLGFDFNFNKYIKGLSAKASLSFDANNSISIGKNLEYASYNVISETELRKVGINVSKGNEQKLGDDFTRLISGNAQIDYDRVFGDHALLVNLAYNISSFSFKTIDFIDANGNNAGIKQDDRDINLGLRLNYAFNNKYIIEGSSSLFGTNRFERGNRHKLYGAIGAGWIMSNENFLNGGMINHLKLKGSYGVMGYDNSLDFFLSRDEYGGAGVFRTGIDNATNPAEYGWRLTQVGNANITFEESKELNIGIEFGTLNNALFLEINYFNELRTKMPVVSKMDIPFYVSNVFPTINYNEVSNKGIDVSLKYSKKIGDFDVLIGGNLMYSKSVYEKYSELNVYEHQNRQGRETDAILGWQADGLYIDEADILGYGVGSALGFVKPGDIKYVDIANLDAKVIDDYDRTFIGHSFPRINYGINLDLKYKKFDFYLLGQGVADVDMMLNNSYYFNYGEGKYSKQVLRQDYPRLTTDPSNHSYRNSSYWLDNGSFFKLRTTQLSYTLPENVSSKVSASKISVYLKGTDLFAVSKIKDLDPEDINAGVTKYPLFKTVSIGAKITF